MSRKPIELELRALQTPRERVWNAVRTFAGPFTPMQAQDRCKPMVQLDAVQDYLEALERGGYLARAGGGLPSGRGKGRTEVKYLVVKRPNDAPRLTQQGMPVMQGMGTLAMWRAMKLLKLFDWHELARAASIDGFAVNPTTAKSYCKLLTSAGYLHPVQPGRPGKAAKLRLVKNTGPHAPAITRRKCVFDRNTGAFAELQTAQEVCDGLE